jgi:hypothetical protein
MLEPHCIGHLLPYYVKYFASELFRYLFHRSLRPEGD